MKYNKIIYLLLINLFLCITSTQPEGFISNTLIKTPSGYRTIDTLLPGDTIVNSSGDIAPISQVNQFRYNSCIKITIQNVCLYCAPDQKLYSHNELQWIRAQDLRSTDLLIDYQENPVAIDAIEIVQQKCLFHSLSLQTDHTFCVSPLDIVAHNIGPVVVVIVETISQIAPIIKTCLTIGATFIGTHFAKKAINKHNRIADFRNNDFSMGCPPKDPNDDDGENKDKYPNGIYKDTKYHHKNSDGSKSKSPKNGQQLLNNAYKIESSEDALIAVEEDYFVIFYKTMEREFHGHIRQWNQLTDHMKNTLIRNGLTKRSGKIIRQSF
jgi:hypothetical protein